MPVQGNLTINAYISNYNWHVVNRALILDQKNDISDEHTQYMFISNMKQCDDVRSIVTFERTSPDQWIKDWYKGENFMNTVSNLYNPFDPSCYTDNENGLMYMRPLSFPPRSRTHDRKHQNKKGSCSRSTKPSKLNLISPLPEFRLDSVHHLLKYDREQSRADKLSAGSNHTSIHKHHPISHLNSTIATRRPDTKVKKKRDGVVNSASVSPAKSTSKSKLHYQQKVSPTLPIQQAYSVQVK